VYLTADMSTWQRGEAGVRGPGSRGVRTGTATSLRTGQVSRLLVLVSLGLNSAILLDMAIPVSGEPVFLGYSLNRLGVMGAYGSFLCLHIVVLAWRRLTERHGEAVFRAAVFVTLYGLAEVVVRFHGLGLITPAMTYRGNYWYAHHPGKTWTFSGGRLYVPQEFQVEITNNSRGYHDYDHADAGSCSARTHRILLLGDSFVEAYQVPLDSTLHVLLQGELSPKWRSSVEVIAIGQSGTGLNWQLQQLDALVNRYRPQVVISEYASWYPGRDAAAFPSAAYGPAAGSRVRAKSDPPGDWGFETRLRNNPALHALIWRNLSNSAGLLFVGLARFLDTLVAVGNGALDEATEPSRTTIAVVENSCEAYAEASLRLEALGARLKVAIYPSKRTVAYYRLGGDSPPISAQTESLVEKCLATRGIDYVNLSRAFAQMDDVPTDGFHYRVDGHWNPTGHRSGARAMSRAFFPASAGPGGRE
jgi:hypothetical protein